MDVQVKTLYSVKHLCAVDFKVAGYSNSIAPRKSGALR
jgi:hypothetical protein